MKFTDRYIDSLKAEGKIVDIREGDGFGVRVLPSGVKTFFFIYRADGKRRFLNLGHYDSSAANGERGTLAFARKEYTAAKKRVDDGADPLAAQDQAKLELLHAPTVAKLVEEYIKKHAKVNKRSWEYDEWLLHKLLLNETKEKGSDEWNKGKQAGATDWSRRKAQDIKKRDVILFLESLVENGTPAMSNQALKIVRKMFAFAVERDILQATPFTGVKALAPNVTRDRTLSETEIKTLWDTLPSCAISGDLQRALKLILMTAQRPGEVSGMHTGEVDGAWWTIPAERSKNGLAHRVYLTETARERISDQIAATREARGITEGTEYAGFIFPCPHLDKDQGIDAHALAVAVRRNLKFPLTNAKGKPLFNADGTPATENKIGVDQFTPHDLRRTAATFMSQLGEMDEVIDAVLNHKKQGIIKVYNQNRYDREKQTALESWGRKLNSIVAGKPAGNVISITTGKGKAKAA